MSTLKRIALTLLAVALPCFAWATEATWTDITTSLPGAASSLGNITCFYSGDFSSKQGTVAGAMVALEKWLTINPGEVKVAWNQNTASGTTGGDAEGAEGYWSENHSITLWGRSGISGMSAAIALADNVTLNELKIKQVRVTGKVRGSYTNANSESVNTASGSCALAVGVARYDGSTYVCAAAAGAQATGGNGSDVAFTATLDIPYADVKAWNVSGTNNDKIILTVSTPSATWNNVYIVQIDKVEYLTLENYEAIASIRTVPGSDADWSTESEWTGGIPTEGKSVEITASENATLTMDADSATLGGLTISGEGTLTFNGSGTLTATATTINTNTDVSGITGTVNLGAVTIAEGKTLTIGANTTYTAVSGVGTLNFIGGTSETPITYDLSGVNVKIEGTAETPSHVKVGPTALQGNRTHTIDGTGPGSAYFYLYATSGFGLADGTSIKNVTLVHSGQKFWWERGDFTGTILQANAQVHLNGSFNPAFAGLEGSASGYISQQNTTARTLNIETSSNNRETIFNGRIEATNVSVAVSGSGTQTFAGANTYTGGTTISGGTLKLTDSGTLGSGTVSVDSGATLAVEIGNEQTKTLENAISGEGAIAVNAGELVLTGTNGNYTGTITVYNDATLKTTGPNASPFGTTNEIVNNGSVIVASDANATPSIAKLSGSGSLTVNSGTLTLATSTYSGATIINDGATLKSTGKLDYGNEAGVTNLEGSAITINANGTLVVGNEVWRKIKGAGKLHVTDSATVIIGRSGAALTGLTDEFTGTVQIDSGATAEFRNWNDSGYAIANGNFIVNGTLNLTAGNNKVAATLTIANGKTLSGTGTITLGTGTTNASVTFADGAILDATAGALTVDGAVTKQGALTIDATGLAAGAAVLNCTNAANIVDGITLTAADGLVLEATGTALVLAAEEADEPYTGEFEVGTSAQILDAVAEIAAAQADGTITLTTGITITETLVIDAGEGNTVTIDLADNALTAGETLNPIIRVESGILKIVSPESTGWASISSQGEGTAIVVGAGEDNTTASGKASALEIGAGVSVSNYGTAVNVVSGSVGGAGTLYTTLVLGAGTTLDASNGYLTTYSTVTQSGALTVKVAADAEDGEVVLACNVASNVFNVGSMTVEGVIGTIEANAENTQLLLKKSDATYTVTSLEELTTAVTAINNAQASATITLSATETLSVAETLVINIGAANTVTLELNGVTLSSSSDLAAGNPTIRIQSGTLRVTNSGSSTMLSSTNDIAVLVGASDNAGTALVAETVCALDVGAGVNVMSSSGTAVKVVSGSVGGAGSIYMSELVLANGATLDASTTPLNLSWMATVEFPDGTLNVKLPAEATMPAQIIQVTNATATEDAYANVDTVSVTIGEGEPSTNYALAANASGYSVTYGSELTVTAPITVTSVPESITLDAGFASYGYGTHTVLTYQGAGTADWTGMEVAGLPDGMEAVIDGNTWGIKNTVLKVLPIGDSITAGLVTYDNSSANFHVPGGYRLPLYQYLTQAYGEGKVKYLGTSDVTTGDTSKNAYEKNAAAGLGDQTHHEGHSGATIDGNNLQMYVRFQRDDVKTAIAAQGTPDVITIHLGTNDIGLGQSGTDAFDEMKQLIYLLNGAGTPVDGITPLYPNAKIFIAKIMARADKDTATETGNFNMALTTYVTGDVAEKVVVVDLNTDVSYGLLRHDSLHPATEGYTRMAQSWFAAIEADADVAPMGATETIASVDSRVAGRLTVTLNKAVDAAGTWTLDNGATVTAASLANDKRTVTLTVDGIVSGTTYTLTADNSATATFTPGAIHVPTKDVAESNRTATAASLKFNGVLKAAEWTTFTGFATGYTSPIGYMPESGRAWQLDVRGANVPTVTDGVLALNGAPLTVNPVDGRLGTTASKHTIVMEVSNLAAGDVLITESTIQQADFTSGNRGSTNADLLKLTVQDATTLLWTDGTTDAVEVSLASLGVSLTDDVPETIALSARWASGDTCSLMVNGTSVATLAIDSTPTESYLASWSIGALSEATTGSSMKLYRLSFYEGTVAALTSTTWKGGENAAWHVDANWTAGVPTLARDAIIPAGSSITLAADATAKSITIDGTVAISGAYTLTVTDTIVIAEGETLKTTNTKLAAPVSGAGTLHIEGTVYSGHEDDLMTVRPASITGLTENTWTGKVIFDSIAIKNLNLSHYGNANSTISLTGLTGSFDHNRASSNGVWGDWEVLEIPANISIDGTVTLTDGYADQPYTFTGDITGSGSLSWTTKGGGKYHFTDMSGFTGTLGTAINGCKIAIGTETFTAGKVTIGGTQTLACTLSAKEGIVVESDATVSGTGTFASATVFEEGSTVDATNAEALLTLNAVSGKVNVKLATGTELPANVFKSINATPSLSVGTVTIGETEGTAAYKFTTNGTHYQVAEAEPVCQIGDTKFATLQDAVDSIDTTSETLTTTTLTLTNDITADQTVVVNVGSALQNNKRYGNTLVIDLAGHTITSTANPAFLVECGILKFESSTAASVSATGEGPAVVVGTGDSTKAYTGLRVGANVTVTSENATSVAVVVGHIGGAGTIKGLNLANETVVDISTGDLLTVTGTLIFPPQVETAGELQNGRVDIYLPEGATFPAPFVNFTGATQAEADKVNTYGKHPGDMNASYNFAPVLTRDNTTGGISGYAIMQYTWITESGELYTTIAEAYADGATDLTQYENTSEYVTVPAGVTVNSGGFTINGNVTVQNGGKYVSYGTINGNLVLEAGSEIDISMNLDHTDETSTFELMVNGDVIFPEGDTIAEGENAGKPNSETVEVTITVGESKSEATLGNPLVLIHSPNGTPGDIADDVTLKIIFAKNSYAIDNYHVVRTSEYYMLSTHDTGACSYDGIEYASIAAALADYTTESNQTIKLNNVAILSDTIVIDVGDGNTVTLDVTGAGIASTANPAIRVQSGNLKLVNTDTTVTSVASMTGTTVLVGANADGSASAAACGLYIGANINVSTDVETPDVNVVNGTVAGEGTITGELKLGEGTTVDATYGILTAGSVDFPYTSVTEGETTTYTNGTIYVVPPAGEAYPAQFIACTAATADAKAHTDVKVILNGDEATDANFLLVVKYGENDAVLGYAVNGEGWEAIAVVGSEMTYWAQFADAATKAGSEGQVILLTDITLAADKATNIYTNGHNIEITESHALTGTLTLSHNSSITTASETSFSATNIVVEANATVIIDGTIASANPIVNNGIIATSSPLVPTEIGGTLQLANGSGINGVVSTTVGTVVDEGATVTVNGFLYGNLTVPNATINGAGAIFILGSDTLTGAGTINPTVTLTSGATIDKIGYEANHLVLTTLTTPAAEDRFTVKANTLANVMNTKTSPVAAANFTVTMADGSAYEAYVAQDSGTNLVIPAVAVNGSDYTVGIVKFNLALAGVPLGEDAVRMASYAYRQGILEVKGVYNNVDAYQLFTNVGTGFTSAGYVMVDYKFGITDITVIDNDGTKYIVVTADVDGVNDKTEGDLSGNAGYRTGTTVQLLDGDGNAVEGAVELTAGNAETYGLVVESVPAGVKYFIVELPTAPADGSESLKFTVKATNE